MRNEIRLIAWFVLLYADADAAFLKCEDTKNERERARGRKDGNKYAVCERVNKVQIIK